MVAFAQIAAAVDLICLLLAGWLWLNAQRVETCFTPLEARLIASGLAGLGWLAMLRLAPTRLGRLLDMPWAVADALLVPLFVGGSVAVVALPLAGPPYASALLLWPMAAVTLLLPCRIFLSGMARRGVKSGWLRRRIAIVGATEMSSQLIDRLNGKQNPETPDIVGIFDDRDAARRPSALSDVPVLGDIAYLSNLASEERLDLIVIALPLNRAIDILRSVQQVQWLTAEVVVLLDGANQAPQGTSRSAIAGQPVLELVRQPMAPGAIVAKAVMDYVLASVALIIVSPLLLAAMIAIRLEGPGPVLFRQPRIGRNGKIFQILKLRTLRYDPTDLGTRGVLSRDDRITRVGRFLRPTCIDELPQLINVLKGDMSMVGPRPHVAHMLVAGAPIEEVAPGYGARHRTKPGITGWAQVNGLSGTMTDTAFAIEVTAHDLAYLSEWSIWLDLRILARTAVVSLFGRKAFEAQSYEWRGL
ncbi:exopolysaccharide biosynthesis polyprenyl glycosylphosphotransferase [Roseococcus sp. SYP-B2431]|uniref:exopolysaccharide biosynthesis polyprenyl glycosylphosphotransferase n=1 Tax=Roseococcus sp. SYP-B2431 TaxID=2496640 RepID=UPI0013F45C40|nr:exopolysaccharide biosynthesis polyprenyl glycosylphosphotransferase [Roseococcus sp. SYP-B2431]